MTQINCFNLESSYQYQRSKKKRKKMHGISIICLVHPIGKLRQHANQLVYMEESYVWPSGIPSY